MTRFNPQIHQRRSIRLKGYDYSQAGAYFITIVTCQRRHLFGEVVDDRVVLNELGQIAQREWFRTAELRSNVELWEDEFVVMPNHVHGIIWIVEGHGVAVPVPNLVPQREHFGKPVAHSIPTIVRAYKSAVTYAINATKTSPGAVLWQSNYYEHILRNDRDLQATRNYILNNPANWNKDDEIVQP